MKKFLILCLFFTFCANTSFAQNISFVYINGSNTNNEKMTKWFLDGMAKTHKDMVKAFNANEFVKKEFLKDGARTIETNAVPFYWGDMSQAEIEALSEDLDVTKIFSPHIAQSVRRFMAYVLHDAIWVTKDYNMSPIIKRLHKTVLDEYKKGNSVVLFGYSAGSFISAQYLAFKAPYINPANLFQNSYLSTAEKNYTKQVQVKNTCLDALVASKLVVLNNENDLIPNNNAYLFKKNYSKLDQYTQMECIPPKALDGVVNFASPLTLFYSNINTAYFRGNIFNAHLIKYLIENDKFFLTVNYAEDPMGFPTTENPRLDQFKVYFGGDIAPNHGFIYDKSDEKSSRTFINAHTSYWATSRKFSKIVAKAYEEGFQHFYTFASNKSMVEQYAKSSQVDQAQVTGEEETSDYTFGSTAIEEEIVPQKN